MTARTETVATGHRRGRRRSSCPRRRPEPLRRPSSPLLQSGDSAEGFLAAWLAVADRLGLGSLLASVRTAFVHGMDLALLFLPGRATVRHEAGRQRVAVS